MTIVLDAGALLAIETGDRRRLARLKEQWLAGRVAVTHGGVIGQVWRGAGPRQALLARALDFVEVVAARCQPRPRGRCPARREPHQRRHRRRRRADRAARRRDPHLRPRRHRAPRPSTRRRRRDHHLLMADHNEVVFETEICEHLAAHGWLYSAERTPATTGSGRCSPRTCSRWLEATQPAAYEKALKAAGSQAKFLDVLTTALDKPLEHGGGTLNILRNGVQYIGGGRLKMAQFRPETTLNETTNAHYAAMRVRVMRQVHFSTADQRSIDLVLLRQRAPGGDGGAEDALHPVAGRGDPAVPQGPQPADQRPRRSRCCRSGTGRWCTSRSPTTWRR